MVQKLFISLMFILNFRTLTIILFMSFTSFIQLKISSTNLTGITRRIMMGFDMRFQIRIMLFFFATSFALIHSVSRTSKIIPHFLFSDREIVKTFKEYKKTLTRKFHINRLPVFLKEEIRLACNGNSQLGAQIFKN